MVLGPVCRLRTHAFYAMILERSWSWAQAWTPEAKEDLGFWSSMFDELHGQPFWKKSPGSAVLTCSDASDTGWGGFLLQNGVEVAKAERPWEVVEQNCSSTWRELRAIALVVVPQQ